MVLGFLSFCAWAIVLICYIGFSQDQINRTAEDDSLTVADVVAIPGAIMFLLAPLAFVCFIVFLLALPFM